MNKTIKVWNATKMGVLDVEGQGDRQWCDKQANAKLVAEWVVSVYSSVQPQTVRNARMKKGYEWF